MIPRAGGRAAGSRHRAETREAGKPIPPRRPARLLLCAFGAFLRHWRPMKPRPDEADEAPAKLSTYTIKLDDPQMEKLRAVCAAKGWEPVEVAYARFAFRGPDVNVTAYDKRRIVV